MEKHDTTKNISEKAFTNLFLTSMIALLVCLCALCSTSYAWFTASVSSGGNVIQSAFFDLDVTVTDTESGTVLTPVDDQYVLEAGKSYTVSLNKTAEANASQGHCALLVDESIYCTEVFPDSFSFTVFSPSEKSVSFDARIGYSAELDLIESMETLTLPA